MGLTPSLEQDADALPDIDFYQEGQEAQRLFH